MQTDRQFDGAWQEYHRERRFGVLVRRLRGKTPQTELAQLCGVAPSLISQVEAGSRKCTLQLAQKLAHQFRLSEGEREKFLKAASLQGAREVVKSFDRLLEEMLENLDSKLIASHDKDRLLQSLDTTIRSWKVTRQRPVSAAVIPIAGWQATLLSREQTERLVDVSIQEAKQCGIEKIVVITSASQQQVAARLRKRRGMDVKTVKQDDTDAGIGNALQAAERELSGQQAFALIFPDDRVKPSCLLAMVEQYKQSLCNVIAVQAWNKAEGDAEMGGVVNEWKYEDKTKRPDLLRIIELEEKVEARRKVDYTIIGRYVLTKDIFSAIDKTGINERTGKLELTDALNVLAQQEQLLGVVCPAKDVQSISAARRRFKEEIDKIFGW